MRKWITGFCAIFAVLATASPGEVHAENEDRSNDVQLALSCALRYGEALRYEEHAVANPIFLKRQSTLIGRLDPDNLLTFWALEGGDTMLSVEQHAEALTECDRTFGFSPITEVIDSRPSIPPIADFDCAVAYRLVAMIRRDSNQAQSAMERAQYALRRYHTANPELDPGSLGPQVNALARTRGERIQQGLESAEALTNDFDVCEAHYSFAAAGVQ